MKNKAKLQRLYKAALKDKVKLSVFEERRDFGGRIVMKYLVITGEYDQWDNTYHKRVYSYHLGNE